MAGQYLCFLAASCIRNIMPLAIFCGCQSCLSRAWLETTDKCFQIKDLYKWQGFSTIWYLNAGLERHLTYFLYLRLFIQKSYCFHCSETNNSLCVCKYWRKSKTRSCKCINYLPVWKHCGQYLTTGIGQLVKVCLEDVTLHQWLGRREKNPESLLS